MNMVNKAYLAIDAGGTYLKSAFLRHDAKMYTASSYKTRSYSEGPKEKIINAYKKIVSNSLLYLKKHDMTMGGIGIATPGPFDYENGIPLMKHKFHGIYGLNLRELMYELAQVSQKIPVVFMHDANAALTGEIWKGNAQGYNNAALVTLGTGLGFSFSQNGKVQTNSQGGPAVSVYSRPCKKGILEDFVSARGILKIYREISGKTDMKETEVSAIGLLANQGDTASRETFRETGYILAESIHAILQVKNIQCLLFGGQISQSFHHIEKGLMEGLKEVNSLKKISIVKDIENTAFLGVLRELIKEDKSEYGILPAGCIDKEIAARRIIP